jgi:hypothetical protein
MRRGTIAVSTSEKPAIDVTFDYCSAITGKAESGGRLRTDGIVGRLMRFSE